MRTESTGLKRFEWRYRTEPVQIQLTKRDMELLWILARDLYATTANTMAAGFRSVPAAQNRLYVLEKAGYVRSAKALLPPARRMLIWSLSDYGAQVLESHDLDRWRTYFTGWTSPADHPDQHKRSVLHEVQRNTWCHRMEQLFLDAGWYADWLPGSAGHVRAYPGGSTMRVELTPDAVMMVNQNYWLIEYERSWRASTLESKLKRYEQYYHHRLWDLSFFNEPRVVFVLSRETTQNNTLLTWIQQFGGTLGGRGWFLWDQKTLDDELIVPAIHWNTQERTMVRDSWFYINEKPPHP